ncbi:type I iodothyronine deiodinase-like [Ptychodera flava]|uniref:type I iodothyronine deiodinase-like n=1 Tax=Ptychodera flava TaxID=63121 RepID=UPI00396A902F
MLRAMVHSGSLRRLFNDYKDKIDFIFVYILEAHPADGWIMGSHYSTFNDATTVDERIDAARLLIEVDTEYKTFTEDIRGVDQIPILLDNMNNDFNRAYSAQPDRIFVLRDGKFEYIGETVSDSLQANPKKLASDLVRDWLETVIVPTVSTVIQSQREA